MDPWKLNEWVAKELFKEECPEDPEEDLIEDTIDIENLPEKKAYILEGDRYGNLCWDVKSFATEVKYAWELVEYMRELGFRPEIEPGDGAKWRTSFHLNSGNIKNNKSGSAEHNSWPMSACLAAKAAIEDERMNPNGQ